MIESPTIIGEPALQPVHDLFTAVDSLYHAVTARARERAASWAPGIARPSFVPSAENLAAYLAFREDDLRPLQDELMPLGLSSLGRCEAHVLPSILAVRATLASLCGDRGAAADRPRPRDFTLGDRLLHRNTRQIFGSAADRRPHIMVTLSSEAATDPGLVRRLVEAGMDSARSNRAHDDADAWCAMARNVRAAARDAQRTCRVYMDIAGPKIRVGAVIGEHRDRRVSTGDVVQLTCTEPAVYAYLRPGAAVWIDDGKLGAELLSSGREGMRVRITHAAPGGSKIKPDKGLNFPGSSLPLPALGAKDRADLDTIVANADVVGQSFVRNAADIRALLDEFVRRGVRLPLVAKIETAEAVTNLPDIIVAGAARVPFGIMIARGDLAIEIGYERLAEIQEEILWMCEAAHVPVVWATQVLDRFVRKGVPTRAEITDAAMGERAECVMLNKGPFIVEAVGILTNVLTRMQGHHDKKSPRLRALRSWAAPPRP